MKGALIGNWAQGLERPYCSLSVWLRALPILSWMVGGSYQQGLQREAFASQDTAWFIPRIPSHPGVCYNSA